MNDDRFTRAMQRLILGALSVSLAGIVIALAAWAIGQILGLI